MALLSMLTLGRALPDVKLEVTMPGVQGGIEVGVLPGPLRGLIGDGRFGVVFATQVILLID